MVASPGATIISPAGAGICGSLFATNQPPHIREHWKCAGVQSDAHYGVRTHTRMGIEYRFSCTPKALKEMEAFLLRTGWERTERDPRQFEYWSGPKDARAWPVATLALEDSAV